MKHLTFALMLNFAIAGAYAQSLPVRLTFSGSSAGSSIDLKVPNTTTGEEDLAGMGSLGTFTFQLFKASVNAPQSSNTCSGLYFPNLAGGGLFRFQDGSLLTVSLTGGADCIDLVHGLAHCNLTFKITGGTGRFQKASGVLTLTETALPVLFDGQNNPVYFSEAGAITGAIAGAPGGDDSKELQL